jgi:hypothetical protein
MAADGFDFFACQPESACAYYRYNGHPISNQAFGGKDAL